MFVYVLMMLFVGGWSFDCYDYAMNFNVGDPNMIPENERFEYLPKLCNTLRACHANPQLTSYDIYSSDVIRCYKSRVYKFDVSVLDPVLVTSYIKGLHDLEAARTRLDTQTALAKDAMTSIVDNVRLRAGYLREFQYARSPRIYGDVLLLLKNERAIFEKNVDRQIKDMNRMSSVTSVQLNQVRRLLADVEETKSEIDMLMDRVAEDRVKFEDLEVKIQKNVIGSLLELSN